MLRAFVSVRLEHGSTDTAIYNKNEKVFRQETKQNYNSVAIVVFVCLNSSKSSLRRNIPCPTSQTLMERKEKANSWFDVWFSSMDCFHPSLWRATVAIGSAMVCILNTRCTLLYIVLVNNSIVILHFCNALTPNRVLVNYVLMSDVCDFYYPDVNIRIFRHVAYSSL